MRIRKYCRNPSGGNKSEDWKDSIREEFGALIKNETSELVERLKDRGVIGPQIVLRNKYNAVGVLKRRKARVVTRGYSQRPGIDFQETFAPVARLNLIRLVAALAVEKGDGYTSAGCNYCIS